MLETDNDLHGTFVTYPNTVPIEESLAGEPECIAMYRSTADCSKVGAFLMEEVPKNVCFGPLVTKEKDTEMYGNCQQGKTSSAWMRFIVVSPCNESYNLIPINHKGKLYYQTCKDIKVDEELLLVPNKCDANFSMNASTDAKVSPFTGFVADDSANCSRSDCHFWKPKIEYAYDTCSMLETSILKPTFELSGSNREDVSDCDVQHLQSIEMAYCADKEVVNKKSASQTDVIHKMEATITGSGVAPDWKFNSSTKQRRSLYQQLLHPYQMCDRIFKTFKGLQHHEKAHSLDAGNEGKESSVTVPVSKSTGQALDTHNKRSRSDTSPTRHRCETCGKTFVSLALFQAHDHPQLGDTTKPHKCDLCGKRFKLLADLLIHHHDVKDNSERPFSCEFCEEKFKTLYKLQSHRDRIHSSKKKHACNVCGKLLRTKNGLQTHRQTHSGQRPFECKICGKKFVQAVNLEIHARIHSGEKPYVCKRCGKAFSQLANLQAHNRTHTGEKPFACMTCGKMFAQLANLQAHCRLHTGERPYVCKVCDAGFHQLSSLKSHLLKGHS